MAACLQKVSGLKYRVFEGVCKEIHRQSYIYVCGVQLVRFILQGSGFGV